jgi:predicted acylesterase/phospholipase RssA
MAVFDLVFEGGGAKGSVFVGALEVLQELGHNHRRLIGTSAGAITATFLAAGYSPKEMLAAVTERLSDGKPRFSTFMDPPEFNDFAEEERVGSETMAIFSKLNLPIPDMFEKGIDRKLLDGLLALPHYRQLFSLVECGGLFSGKAFLAWLREKLAAKGVGSDETFGGLFRRTGRDLSLVASDTSDVEMLVLNHRTAPDCPVAWAVRMSMSIPFVWREVVWRKEWGTYRGRSKVGHIIVDGGVLSNFPIRLIAAESFDDPLVAAVMGSETRAADAGNLGLLIDEGLAVTGERDDPRPPGLTGRLRTVQRISRLVDTMMRAQDNMVIKDHEHEICRLPAKGYGTTEFDMDPVRLQKLVEGGRAAMRAHFGSARRAGA